MNDGVKKTIVKNIITRYLMQDSEYHIDINIRLLLSSF